MTLLLVEIDECLSFPCQNGAECLDEVNGYKCIDCVAGFNGTHCETGITHILVNCVSEYCFIF